jgi:hypothetical protein
MFWVQYTASDAPKRQDAIKDTGAKQTVAEAGARRWRPVGEATETAAIKATSEPSGR